MDGEPQKSISRSGLLKLGAMAAVVLGAGPVSRAVASDTVAKDGEAVPAGGRVGGPSHLQLATYIPLVGSTFTIHRPNTTSVPVKLISATRLRSEVGESFSLIFRGDGNAKLEQETYTIEHGKLGQFPLFVVPVGPARKGQALEVVVNRIPSSLMPRV